MRICEWLRAPIVNNHHDALQMLTPDQLVHA